VNDESLIPALHNLDPVVLQQVYEAPAMQDIWNTIGYLNQKGISGKQVLLNFMGWTPVWLGGSGQYGVASYITGGKEQSFATMVASLIYYGRTVRRLNFTYVGPLNESDWNCLEGPCVSPNQYVRIMRSLASELDYMGLTDIRFITPDTAADPGSYISAIANDSVVFGRTDAFTNHTYGGTAVAGTYYPQKHYWITETGASCSSCDYAGTPSQGEWSFASQTNDNVIDDISSGQASVLVYDGYDSFYYHHNSFGYWGLLAFDTNSRVYTPRKRFYVNGQINKFIAPGSSRVGLTTSLRNLPHAAAIYNFTTGRITIVGHNSGSSPLKIDGQLVNGPVSSGVFHLFQTSQSVNFQQGADVTISGGQFSVTIPADTFFTLTN
jgi:O-glycosyl hydrolase